MSTVSLPPVADGFHIQHWDVPDTRARQDHLAEARAVASPGKTARGADARSHARVRIGTVVGCRVVETARMGPTSILQGGSERITPQNQGIFCGAHVVFRACAHRGEVQTIVELLRWSIRDADLKGRPRAPHGTRLIYGLGHHLPGDAPL